MARLGRRPRNQPQTDNQTSGTVPREHLDFAGDQEFRPAINGVYRGRFIKVHARGNTKGMSATWWITNERGQSQIVSLHEVTLTDANYIAPTVEQMDQLLDAVQFDQP